MISRIKSFDKSFDKKSTTNIFSHNNFDHKHLLPRQKLTMAVPTPSPVIRLPPRRNMAHISVNDDAPPSPTATVATSLVRRLYAQNGDDCVNNRRRNRAPNSLLAADNLHSLPRKAIPCSHFRMARSPRRTARCTLDPSSSVFNFLPLTNRRRL